MEDIGYKQKRVGCGWNLGMILGGYVCINRDVSMHVKVKNHCGFPLTNLDGSH